MSTTTLVGAGIGVTVAIFAVIFGIVWLSKRNNRKKASTARSAPSSPVRPIRPAPSNTKDQESAPSSEESAGEKERRASTDKKALRATVVDADSQDEYEESVPQYSPPRQPPPQLRPLQAPPPAHHRRPDLQRSAPSEEGSPVEPVPSRELYPSNPSPKPRHLQASRRGGASTTSRQPQGQPGSGEKIPPIPPYRADRQGSTQEIPPSEPPQQSQRTRLTSASSVSSTSSGASTSSASIPPIPPFNPQRHATRLAETHTQPVPVTVPTKPTPTPSGGRPSRPTTSSVSASSRQSRMDAPPRRPEERSRPAQGAMRPLDIRKSIARPPAAPPLLVPEKGGGTRRSVLPSYYERPVSGMSTTSGRMSVRQSSMLQDAPPLPPPSTRAQGEVPGNVIGPKSDTKKGRTIPVGDDSRQNQSESKQADGSAERNADKKGTKLGTAHSDLKQQSSLAPPTSEAPAQKGGKSPGPSPGVYDGLAPPSGSTKSAKSPPSASRSPSPAPPKTTKALVPNDPETSPETAATQKKKKLMETTPPSSTSSTVEAEATERKISKSPAGKKKITRRPDPTADGSSASDSEADDPAPPRRPVRSRKPGGSGQMSDQEREKRSAAGKDRSANGSRKDGMI